MLEKGAGLYYTHGWGPGMLANREEVTDDRSPAVLPHRHGDCSNDTLCASNELTETLNVSHRDHTCFV